MAKLIPLTQGYSAVVDDEDFAAVSQFKWRAKVEPHTVYAVRTITKNGRRTQLPLHRFLLECSTGQQVDHRDRDGLNCQHFNMRCASRSEQQQNRRALGRSSFKGVTFRDDCPAKPWRAMITFAGQQIRLGYFATKVEAARAYDQKARELYGPYARLNFPDEAIDAAA